MLKITCTKYSIRKANSKDIHNKSQTLNRLPSKGKKVAYGYFKKLSVFITYYYLYVGAVIVKHLTAITAGRYNVVLLLVVNGNYRVELTLTRRYCNAYRDIFGA